MYTLVKLHEALRTVVCEAGLRTVISVIIPTYFEENALPQTLNRLPRQASSYEVIVVDGGTNDRT